MSASLEPDFRDNKECNVYLRSNLPGLDLFELWVEEELTSTLSCWRQLRPLAVDLARPRGRAEGRNKAYMGQ